MTWQGSDTWDGVWHAFALSGPLCGAVSTRGGDMRPMTPQAALVTCERCRELAEPGQAEFAFVDWARLNGG